MLKYSILTLKFENNITAETQIRVASGPNYIMSMKVDVIATFVVYAELLQRLAGFWGESGLGQLE